jgi:hypothetical protein
MGLAHQFDEMLIGPTPIEAANHIQKHYSLGTDELAFRFFFHHLPLYLEIDRLRR